MSTSGVLEHGRNLSQEHPCAEIKGTTEDSTRPSNIMEIPRTFAAVSERDSDSLNMRRPSSSHSNVINREKRAGIVLQTQMGYLAESKYYSDDSQDEENQSPNYVCTKPPKDEISRRNAGYSNTFLHSLPITASHNATDMSSSQDFKDTTQYSRTTEPILPMQIGNSKFESSSGSQQNTSIEEATESDHTGRNFETLQIQSKKACLHSSAAVYKHKATFDETPDLFSDEPRKSASPTSGRPRPLDEHAVSNRLEHESCFGIGSWSRIEESQIAEIEQTTILEDLDSVPAELYAMFDKNWLAHTTGCTNGSSATQGAVSESQNGRGEKTSTTTVRRYHGSSDGKSTDEDESGEDVPGRRRRGPTSSNNMGNQPRLACPFYKNNSQVFGTNSINGGVFRCCAGPGFNSIARLKAHLYRLHRIPLPNCPQCGVPFKSQEKLNEHQRSEMRCELGPLLTPKSITHEIEKKLKEKKRTSRSPAESWRGIYQLIFPNEPVPSPYYEASEEISPTSTEFPEIEDYDYFFNRELPGIFGRYLELGFPGHDPQSRELRCLFLSDFQKQVSSMYHKAQQAAGSSTLGADVASMSTPKASFGFEPHLNVESSNFATFTTPSDSSWIPSWCQPYEGLSNAYHQVQYPQEGPSTHRSSMESVAQSHRLGSLDSGYSTHSICFSAGSGQCSCYDSSNPGRHSFDDAPSAGNFPDTAGWVQDLCDPAMDISRSQNNFFISIPRTNLNPDEGFLPLQ